MRKHGTASGLPVIRASGIVAVAVATIAASGPVAAEVCTCASETFTLASVTDAGGWDGCIPSDDDHFEIGGGCRVEIAGDFVQDGTTPAVGIEVQAGGELEVAMGRDLVLNQRLLRCLPGSSCTLAGGFREWDTSPALQPR